MYDRNKKKFVCSNHRFDRRSNSKDHCIASNLDKSMLEKDSYERIAREAVDKGFISFPVSTRKNYEKTIKRFLEFYKRNYGNAFAKDFKTITDFYIVQSKAELLDKICFIIDKVSQVKENNENMGVYILYRIVNKEKQLIRIGITGDSPEFRLVRYLSKSFLNTMERITKLHMDIRALGNRNKFNDKFEYQILCVSGNFKHIKSLERLFTIYENRYDNDIGYDLSVNNYYNKIVGDLFDYIDGEFENFHPNWRDISPDKLETSIKECLTWEDMFNYFPEIKEEVTIMRRAVFYGFTLKSSGGIQDMRAYFIKPIIEEGILKSFDPEQITNLLIIRGFISLKKLSNTPRARMQWLNKLCNFIWKTDMNKLGYNSATLHRVRKLVLFNEILKLARNPKYNTFYKAEAEIRMRGIVLRPPKSPKDKGELHSLIKNLPLKKPFFYKVEQNKILAPVLASFLKQEDPILSIGDIAEKFSLDRYNDKFLILNLIIRIFKKYIQNCRSIDEIREFLKATQFY